MSGVYTYFSVQLCTQAGQNITWLIIFSYQKMVQKTCEEERAWYKDSTDYDGSVSVILSPLEVQNDGELDEGWNIEDPSRKNKRHL